MARDKAADPRLEARAALADEDTADAQVWALLNVGDALHRIAKAIELQSDPDEVESARYRHDA